jgi:hypothetical protein
VDISRLVEQAEQCVVMVRARRLAAWVGEGRSVTAKAVLRRPDVPDAAKAVGVDLPVRFRSAADVQVLHHPWLVAQAAGLIVVGASRATPGPGTDGGPLQAWLAGLDAVMRAESHDKSHCGAAVVCRLVLTALAAEPSLTRDQLQMTVHFLHEDLDFDEVHAMSDAFRPFTIRPTDAALAILAEFDAVDGQAHLTPLGWWAAEQLQARANASRVTPDLPARTILARMATVRDDEAWRLMNRWRGERSVVETATELLRAAAAASPAERVAAVDVVMGMGEEARPAWQAVLGVPELAVHAGAVLAAWQEGGTELDEAQQRWLAVEEILVTLARDGVEAAYYDVVGQGGLAEMLPSGHPDEAVLREAVEGFVASGQRLRVYQVKIELHRFRPPVWRRVLIPACASLGDLHVVIQVVLDWDGDHMHSFTDGNGVEYSDAYHRLDQCADEDLARLSRVLPAVKSALTYVYDFGDWWEHKITLEKVLDADDSATYPTCLAGEGDAPVEDWNPEFPEKPTPYDRDDINRQLAALDGSLSSTTSPK